jgi:ribosomal-protein-serine acetyltransferase
MDADAPILTDGVITLRPPTEADAPAMVAAVRSSLAELTPFMPWATADYGEANVFDWLRDSRAAGDIRYLILGEDGELAGGCGLNLFNRFNNSANLGYWLRSDRTGRGYATRAVRLLAGHGLKSVNLERIEIFMSVENEPSRRVAERAGATFEGTQRHRLLLHGRYHDTHVFSLIRGDID